MARYRRHSAEVFVPLSHPPGEAQFDFGHATVEIAGVERKAACAVMCLPYSDAFLVQANLQRSAPEDAALNRDPWDLPVWR